MKGHRTKCKIMDGQGVKDQSVKGYSAETEKEGLEHGESVCGEPICWVRVNYKQGKADFDLFG